MFSRNVMFLSIIMAFIYTRKSLFLVRTVHIKFLFIHGQYLNGLVLHEVESAKKAFFTADSD